ncbi:hypothetical protein ABTZ03_03005 [Kitasatospora sp. NPDC096077]|uniref:hypothetical protein n=1 Tax=Kitasatospora sp. NPDC096077 TaxID=3155544 RepID=UPI00331CF27E
MPAESTRDIHTGDVSGTLIVGDNNHVKNTTDRPEQPNPQPQPQPRQQNTAEDQAAVFAVEQGTLHVTYNAQAEPQTEH